MQGTPVWLCSISRESLVRRGRLATSLWSPQLMRHSIDLLRRVIGPAGNPARERVFRMQITTCLHRALSDAEIAGLPDWFHAAEAIDLGGGPVEILEETERGSESTRPCHAPERIPIDPSNPLLWFPGDCGRCPPCRARAAYGNVMDARAVIGEYFG